MSNQRTPAVRPGLEVGMTLVELGMVLAIISVLAAITVPRSIGWIRLAEHESTENEMAALAEAFSAVIARTYLGPSVTENPEAEDALCDLPGTTLGALAGVLGRTVCTPGGFAGANPANDAPYVVRLGRVFPRDSAAADAYQIEISTCVPFASSTTRSDVTLDCGACGVSQCRVTHRRLAALSETLQRLRMEKRDRYCCELVDGVGGLRTDCSNWNADAPAPIVVDGAAFPGPGTLSERMQRFCK